MEWRSKSQRSSNDQYVNGVSHKERFDDSSNGERNRWTNEMSQKTMALCQDIRARAVAAKIN